jgi:hypothetical protein
MVEEKSFFCDTSIVDDAKWKILLDIAIKECNYVEFNVLSNKYKNEASIKEIEEFFCAKSNRISKFLNTNKFLKYQLSKKVISFITSKKHNEWLNYCFEDISFFKDDEEFLFTITHENYVFLFAKNKFIEEINNLGFAFTNV